jgi:hypothetical protein
MVFVKSCLFPRHEGIQGEYTFLASALRPRRFTLEKELRHSLKRRLGRSQSRYGRFWRRGSLLPLPGFESRAVQTVASRYPGSWYVVYINLIVTVRSISQFFRTLTFSFLELSYLALHIVVTDRMSYKMAYGVRKVQYIKNSFISTKFYENVFLCCIFYKIHLKSTGCF